MPFFWSSIPFYSFKRTAWAQCVQAVRTPFYCYMGKIKLRGKGHSGALNSASHGAGRKRSRQAAKAAITGSQMKKMLSLHGVTLIGGGTDEAPTAYKNIEQVMQS